MTMRDATDSSGGGGSVAVVGSCHLDTVYTVPRLPAPGVTVTATDRGTGPGGKGANQAVAAARLGAGVLGSPVAMVGAVGNDAAADVVRRALTDAGVDDRAVRTIDDAPTGGAIVVVGADGENLIIVHSGANARLEAAEVTAELRRVEPTVLLAQMEVPLDVVIASAGATDATVVLNPAPMPDDFPVALLDEVDVLVPNEPELRVLAAQLGADAAGTLAQIAARVASRAHVDLVVTAGAAGALVVASGGEPVPVDAVAVDVVDTTGAGDAFCAGLGVALAVGRDLLDAVHVAVRAGACAVTTMGAQAALPPLDVLDGRRD